MKLRRVLRGGRRNESKEKTTGNRVAKRTSNHQRRSTKLCSRARTSTVDRLASALFATARYCSNARHAPPTLNRAPRLLRYRLSLTYRFYPISPTIPLHNYCIHHITTYCSIHAFSSLSLGSYPGSPCPIFHLPSFFPSFSRSRNSSIFFS